MRLKFLLFSALLLLKGAATVVGYHLLGGFVRVPSCADAGCPELESLSDYQLAEPPALYDAHGRLFSHLDGDTRLSIPLSQMPPLVVDGYVAVEDRRFWSHGGVDLLGVARASVVNLVAGEVREGASTIHMQLARTLWRPAFEPMGRWQRKLAEARLALGLEDEVGKPRTLELYLNSIYLGEGVYGVGAAAWHYFGKPVSSLSVAETATLIGMTRTPERYNPRRYPDRARWRRDVVLGVLAEQGVLDSAATRVAQAEPPVETIPEAEAPDPRGASYYAAAVARELHEVLSGELPRREWTGLRVHTAYEPEVQQAAERHLQENLSAIERGERGAYRHAVPDEAPAARSGTSPYLQGAVVVLDNGTGAIRALVGGRSFSHSQFDRALQARRPAGSAFKPIVVAAALATGGASLASPVSTTPLAIETPEGSWRPRDGQSEGRAMTVSTALARSSNLAAVRIGQRAGIDRVVTMAYALGVRSSLPAVPSLFLGAADVRLVDLTGAYAAFANGGRRVTPHLIERIEDWQGNLLYERPREGARALDPRIAFLTRRALSQVIESGTGWRVRTAGYGGEAAGKTGTSSNSNDAWFIGVNPVVSAGVWIGFDRPQNIVPGGSGSNLAAPVWGGMMADLFERPWPTWPSAPHGLVERHVEAGTGLLSTESCRATTERVEYFIPGTEPQSMCDLMASIPDIHAEARRPTMRRLDLPSIPALSMRDRIEHRPLGTP